MRASVDRSEHQIRQESEVVVADRTSAEIFTHIFRHLANDDREWRCMDGSPRDAAKKFWRLSWQYDFSCEQLDCDESLITLGLAREFTNADGDQETEYRTPDCMPWVD